ncbi:hypothetical protein LY76DRAFT_587508 [Colletotrichum caudatum]|nr:hypothetical protein LY76DRAFT_587508 [Colletotrichum caudatum]
MANLMFHATLTYLVFIGAIEGYIRHAFGQVIMSFVLYTRIREQLLVMLCLAEPTAGHPP